MSHLRISVILVCCIFGIVSNAASVCSLDKHQINRIQRVQIIFDSIAELRTLLRCAVPDRKIVVATGAIIAAGTRTE